MKWLNNINPKLLSMIVMGLGVIWMFLPKSVLNDTGLPLGSYWLSLNTILISVLLLLSAKNITHLASTRLDKKTMMVIGLAATFALIIYPFLFQSLGGTTWVRILGFALLYIMLALGLNIVVGMAGLLDLGYIAFYAVGAYTVALLSSPHLSDSFEFFKQAFPNGMHLPLWSIVPLGAAFAALAGVMLGTPILKLRGDYLALVTLGFGEIIRIFMNNLGKDGFNLTNGPRGILKIDPLSIFGYKLNQSITLPFGDQVVLIKEMQYYYVFLILVVLSIMACYRLQNSRLGRAWVALREDDIAVKAMGINVRNVKLLAFALGATFGGVAGGMFASFQGFVSPESFSFVESILVLSMVVLGGMGYIPGVIMGAIILTVLPNFLQFNVVPLQMQFFGHEYIDAGMLRQLLFGLAMVLVMLFRPKGLWAAPTHEDKTDDEKMDDQQKNAAAIGKSSPAIQSESQHAGAANI